MWKCLRIKSIAEYKLYKDSLMRKGILKSTTLRI